MRPQDVSGLLCWRHDPVVDVRWHFLGSQYQSLVHVARAPIGMASSGTFPSFPVASANDGFRQEQTFAVAGLNDAFWSEAAARADLSSDSLGLSSASKPPVDTQPACGCCPPGSDENTRPSQRSAVSPQCSGAGVQLGVLDELAEYFPEPFHASTRANDFREVLPPQPTQTIPQPLGATQSGSFCA
jgi:hypothetical protein